MRIDVVELEARRRDEPARRWITHGEPTPDQAREIADYQAMNPLGIAILRVIVAPIRRPADEPQTR